MCDCYEHKCELCDEMIPMHIGDYKFPQKDFKVWCGAHIPRAKKGSIVFEVIEHEDNFDDYPIGWKCAIYGPEVGDINDGNNHPNIGMEMKEYKSPPIQLEL